MAKGSGGAGRGGSTTAGSKAPKTATSSYGPGIELRDIRDTSLPPGTAASVPTADMKSRILVKPVTQGTERQIDYAVSLKAQAIERVDRWAHRGLQDPRFNRDKLISFRNRLISAINNDTNARNVIDNLRRGSIEDWARSYNIQP